MNFVISAANVYLWISLECLVVAVEEVEHRLARCCPFAKLLGLCSRSSCLAAFGLFC